MPWSLGSTLDNPKVATKALKLVNTHFKGLSSLQEIIIEVYEDGASDYLRRELESHGWTISIAEYVEEDFGRGLSDFEDDGHGYDSRGDDDDNNDDIDNSSDFWRRAGD